MSKTKAAYVACSIMAAFAAVLLGYAAGNFMYAGAGGGGELLAALAMCTVSGIFAYVARKLTDPPLVNPPAEPDTPVEHRRWCRTDW